jgi:hypothetical protein
MQFAAGYSAVVAGATLRSGLERGWQIFASVLFIRGAWIGTLIEDS